MEWKSLRLFSAKTTFFTRILIFIILITLEELYSPFYDSFSTLVSFSALDYSLSLNCLLIKITPSSRFHLSYITHVVLLLIAFGSFVNYSLQVKLQTLTAKNMLVQNERRRKHLIRLSIIKVLSALTRPVDFNFVTSDDIY